MEKLEHLLAAATAYITAVGLSPGWSPEHVIGRPFGRLVEAIVDLDEKPEPKPEPPQFTYVGPNDPRWGTLQIVREGAERTLCDLPVQRDYWKTQTNIIGRPICLQCKALAAELAKTA